MKCPPAIGTICVRNALFKQKGKVYTGKEPAKYAVNHSWVFRTLSIVQNAIRKRKYNNYPSDRTIGSIDHCQSCGKEYIVKSGNQKYCSDCSAEKISEKAKIRARKNISQNKEKNISRKKSHRGKRYVCKICGTIFEKHGAEVTCSPECKKELSRIRQNEADIKRGRRARPASERYESGLPKSGIVGITWRRNGKWTAKYKNHYIGVYDTIDAAKESLEQYKKNLP